MYLEDLAQGILSARSLAILSCYLLSFLFLYLAWEKKLFEGKLLVAALTIIFLSGFFSIDTAVGVLTSALATMTIGLMWLAIQQLRRAARKANVIIAVSYEKGSIRIANRGTHSAKEMKIVSEIIGLSGNSNAEIEADGFVEVKCKKTPERIEIRWTTDDEQILSYGVWRKPKTWFSTRGYYILESSN